MKPSQRILFVPGKNPKPPSAQHRRELLRSMLRGLERADPNVARDVETLSENFMLVAWNPIYYQRHKPLDEDMPWIDALLRQHGPTEGDIAEALSLRTRFAWSLYNLADRFHFLIPLLPDTGVKSTIRETARYFNNDGGIGEQVRELLKVPLRRMFAAGERILIIAHSMGSIIAYDALWELTHIEKCAGRVDMLMTIGSPLGMRFTQQRLLGWHETGPRRYPHNIRHWINISSQGDLTALDPTLREDFNPMLQQKLVESITDLNGGIYNYFRNHRGLNVHRSYGYLVNPQIGKVIAGWWKQEGIS